MPSLHYLIKYYLHLLNMTYSHMSVIYSLTPLLHIMTPHIEILTGLLGRVPARHLSHHQQRYKLAISSRGRCRALAYLVPV